MNTRGLPGMFAPTYQELARGNSVASATSSTCATQPSSASGVASIVSSAVLAQVADAVRDPVDVLLDRQHHVAQHRRAARAGDEEQVGEAGGREAEIGARPAGPLVLQRTAPAPADVDVQQRPGHRVEAGREHDHVELVRAARGLDPARREPHDRRVAHVDERHVVAVVRRRSSPVSTQMRLVPTGWLVGHRASAVAGSRTIARILSRTKSAAVAFASALGDDVVERQRDRRRSRPCAQPRS